MSEQQSLFAFDLEPMIHEGIAAVVRAGEAAGTNTILKHERIVKDLLVARTMGFKKSMAARYAAIDPTAFGRLINRGKSIIEKVYSDDGEEKDEAKLKNRIDAEETPEAVFMLYWNKLGTLMLMKLTAQIQEALKNSKNVKAAIDMRKQLLEEMQPPAKDNGSAVKSLPGVLGGLAEELEGMGVDAVMDLHVRVANKIPMLAKKKQEVMGEAIEAEIVEDDGTSTAA